MEELEQKEIKELQQKEVKEDQLQEEVVMLNEPLDDGLNDKIMQVKELLIEEELKRKKHRKFMIGFSIVLLLSTIGLGTAGVYLGNRMIKTSQKSDVISNLTPVSRTQTLGVTEIVKKSSPSVVEIQVANKDFENATTSAGSGVIISENGYIVTNYHVLAAGKQSISEDSEINVRLHNGNTHKAKLIGADSRTDLAVIKIEASGLKKAEIGNSDEIVVGENAIAIGNSLGKLGGTVTKGIVSAVSRESNVGTYKLPLIQTDAPVNRGNSGGGLFNDSGQLIGIVTQKVSGETVEGLGFAIPSNVVVSITKDIIDNGYVKNRPTMGISVQEVKKNQLFRSESEGIYVTESSNDALKRYDLLKEVNGHKIETIKDVLDAISENKVGDVIKVKVIRDNQEMEVDVTLKEASR